MNRTVTETKRINTLLRVILNRKFFFWIPVALFFLVILFAGARYNFYRAARFNNEKEAQYYENWEVYRFVIRDSISVLEKRFSQITQNILPYSERNRYFETLLKYCKTHRITVKNWQTKTIAKQHGLSVFLQLTLSGDPLEMVRFTGFLEKNGNPVDITAWYIYQSRRKKDFELKLSASVFFK